MEENTQTVQEENVDSVLNSVSDQYLAKKKKNRKITFSIISIVVLLLSVAIIVMSCVKINTKPAFIKGATSYQVTINNSEKLLLDETNEEFDEFDKLFDETFSYNYLNALFAGKLGGYDICETTSNFYSDTKNNTGMSTTLKNQLGSNYVRVKFDEDKTIKYSNGKEYKSIYYSDYSITFNELYFNLNTSDEESEITFYIGAKGYLKGITKITIEANTYALYDFATNN